MSFFQLAVYSTRNCSAKRSDILFRKLPWLEMELIDLVSSALVTENHGFISIGNTSGCTIEKKASDTKSISVELWWRGRLTKWAISLTNDSSLISWKQIFIRLTVAIPSPSSIAVLFASLEQYCIQCIFITLVRILWHDSDYDKKLFGWRCLRMLELANATSSNPFPFFSNITSW